MGVGGTPTAPQHRACGWGVVMVPGCIMYLLPHSRAPGVGHPNGEGRIVLPLSHSSALVVGGPNGTGLHPAPQLCPSVWGSQWHRAASYPTAVPPEDRGPNGSGSVLSREGNLLPHREGSPHGEDRIPPRRRAPQRGGS